MKSSLLGRCESLRDGEVQQHNAQPEQRVQPPAEHVGPVLEHQQQQRDAGEDPEDPHRPSAA
jgi:hypothetical protein